MDNSQAPGVSAPSHVTWAHAISMPVKAICEPTDRSI
jgi:hypothetical protein